MRSHHEIGQGVDYFPETTPMDEAGKLNLQVNLYLVQGSKKNMLIDTGAAIQVGDSIRAISEVIDPQKLDYIFVTHMDADHFGGVQELLKLAPQARIVGNMTVMGKGSGIYGINPQKFAVVFPGEEIDLGNHKIQVVASLIEDGHTYWLLDKQTGTFFSSDAFGSVHLAPPKEFAEAVPSEAFAGGFMMWHSMNFNMFPRIDVKRFQQDLAALRRMDIQQIASVHGPIVRNDVHQAFDLMEAFPSAELPPPPPLPDFLRLPAVA